MGDGFLNFKYACSGPGLLKFVTLVLGLISAGLITHGLAHATVFSDKDRQGQAVDGCSAGDKFTKAFTDKPCPPKWLVVMAVSITFICLIISAVCYLVLLIVKLNDNSIFCSVDFIYHVCGGLAILAAGCFALSWSGLAINYMDCSSLTAGDSFSKDECEKNKTKKYQALIILFGGIGAAINGIVHILIGFKVKPK